MGAGGVKNFSVGICDGPPSTARSSFTSPYHLVISIHKKCHCHCFWNNSLLKTLLFDLF